jgi:hypothetical protein
VTQRFPGDPESAAAVVQHHPASAGAMEGAVGVDEGADRAGAGVHQVALAGREAGAVGDFHVSAEVDRGRVDVQQLGQPALQQFAVAAKAGQPGLHPHRHAMRQHVCRQFGKGGAHGLAAMRTAHLQGRQARHHALGQDRAPGRGERPAGLGAAGVDAEAEFSGVGGVRLDHDRSEVYAGRGGARE